MRADVLESSLRGIQRRRLRGLGVLPSLTSPMIPSSGGAVGSDPDRSAYRVAENTTFALADATLAPPLMRMAGPLSMPFVATLDPPPSAAGILPRFGAGPGLNPGAGAGDPLGVGAETEGAEESADIDRADAGGYITDDSVRDVIVSDEPRATPGLLSRYKWWILGFFVAMTGAGGLWAWRMARGRR